MTRARFWRVMLVILLAATAVRVGYVAIAKPNAHLRGDQLYYSTTAKRLADGKGFHVDPRDAVKPLGITSGPDAAHPPLTVVALTPVSFASKFPPLSWIDHARVMQQRYMMALFGALLVLLIGLLARAIGGDTAGLWAAGIAAFYPNLWVNDGVVMSETITNLTVVALLLALLALVRRPSVRNACWCGALGGLAMLARAELVLFLPVVAVVLFATTRSQWLRLSACFAGVALLVIAPWVAYNNVRFHDPVFISTQDGLTVAGSNCRTHYYGNLIGMWGLEPDCVGATFPAGDESQRSVAFRHRAWTYAQDHLARWPLVAAARLGRTFGVYRPMDVVRYHQREGRERAVSIAGLVTFFPLALLAALGLRQWWNLDRAASLLLLAPLLVVVVTTVLTYGQFRFRTIAEPSFVVLAALYTVTRGVPRTPSPSPSRRRRTYSPRRSRRPGAAVRTSS